MKFTRLFTGADQKSHFEDLDIQFMLEGAMEIEIGDGTKRIFNMGDIVLAEDTTGQGHITRAASEGVRKYMVITLK